MRMTRENLRLVVEKNIVRPLTGSHTFFLPLIFIREGYANLIRYALYVRPAALIKDVFQVTGKHSNRRKVINNRVVYCDKSKENYSHRAPFLPTKK